MTGLETFPPHYRFCTQCGKGDLEKVAPFEFRCPACGFRHFINPISAVAAILTDAKENVLLIRRAIEPGRGELGLPGGFVDPGENAETAIVREVKEEVGLELSGWKFFVSVPNVYHHQNYDWPVLDLFFTLTLPDFQAARAVSEVQELVVTPLKQLDPEVLAFPSLRKAVEVYRKSRYS